MKRIHHGELAPIDDSPGDFGHALRRVIVRVEQVRPDVNDEFAIAGITLPVELIAAVE